MTLFMAKDPEMDTYPEKLLINTPCPFKMSINTCKCRTLIWLCWWWTLVFFNNISKWFVKLMPSGWRRICHVVISQWTTILVTTAWNPTIITNVQPSHLIYSFMYLALSVREIAKTSDTFLWPGQYIWTICIVWC